MRKATDDKQIRAMFHQLGRPSLEVLDREIARQERIEAYWRLAAGMVAGLIATAAVIVLVTNLWITVWQVTGTSMEPLLKADEIVLAVKDDSPAKGDVIALYCNNRLYIKRVIAMAGDRVEIKDDGTVLVNGEAISEPYAAEKSLMPCDIEFPFQVPGGTMFVMGDNRADSFDSRDSRFGAVPREQIIGRVVFRAWPVRAAGRIR